MLAEVLGGEVAVHDPAGEPLAGRPRRRATGGERCAEAVRVRPRRSRTTGVYVAAALAGTEHVATLVLARRAEPLDLRRAPHPRARRDGHRAGAAVRPHRRRGRGPARRRAARRPARRPDAEPTRRCASGRGASTSTSTRRSWSRWPPSTGWSGTPRSGRSARLAGGAARAGRRAPRGGWCCSCPGDDPLAVGRALAEAALGRPAAERTVGVAAADPDRAAPRRTPRPGAASTRCSPWAAPARSATRPGSAWPGCCSARTAPSSSPPSSTPRSARCSAYDAERGTEPRRDPRGVVRRRAAGSRRPPRALHVHPNTVTQRLDRVGELLGDDWRDPARGLDLQLALRVHRLRAVRPRCQRTCLGTICVLSHTWFGARAGGLASGACPDPVTRDLDRSPRRSSPAAPAASARAVAARLAELGAARHWCSTATTRRRPRSPPTIGGDHLVGRPHRRRRRSTRLDLDGRHPRQQRRHPARRADRGLRPRAVRAHPPADARGAVPARPGGCCPACTTAAGAGSSTSPASTATAPRRTSRPTSAPSTGSRGCPR